MKTIIAIFFSLICHITYCQDIEKDSLLKKPKIGLVLSGGGSKGFAHIGVLKVIEEAGLKIDYIGGTSMGAAVGALYASGYNATQIDSIITSINFMKTLTDDVDRKHASFFSKKNDEKYLLNLPIKKFKIGLPLALSKGQTIFNKLSELYYPVKDITDFSKLPIPFYCIATNIENGKAIEINNGSLPNAIRSSASLPTLLSPNKTDNNLTVIDGGISNNFPVEIMKNKGVDIVIGVDVQGVLKQPENIDSAIELIDQIINYQLYGAENDKTDEVEIYIHPDVYDYEMIDFENNKEIIKEGEVSARRFYPQFKKLATLTGAIQQKAPLYVDNKDYTINNINVTGTDHYTLSYLTGRLDIKKGDRISNTELSCKINYLTKTNNFNSVRYSFNEKDSLVDLNFKIEENPQSLFLRFGGHYDSTYKLAGLINITEKHLFLNNDIISFDLAFGDNIRAEFNYFVDNGHFLGYGFNSVFNQLESSVFLNDNSINFKFSNLYNYIYSQANFRNKFAISLGFEHQRINSFTDNIIPTGDMDFDKRINTARTYFDKSDYINFLGKIELDTYDNKDFPKNGYLIASSFRTYLSSTDYNDNFDHISQARILLEGIKTISNRFALSLQADGAMSLTLNNQENLNFGLGGYGDNFIVNRVPFHGYTFSELIGNSYLKVAASLRYRFYKENYIDFYGNYAIVTDNVIEFLKDEKFFRNARSGYSVGYSANSFLGPIEVRCAWSPENQETVTYIGVGYWF